MLERKVVENTIGKTFADSLDEIVIDVSDKLTFTKRMMVENLGCANFAAASRVNRVLKKLKIETPAQLFRTDPFSLARTKSIGATSIYVVMCILDASQYNVEEWWGWKETNVLKFSSFKHNAIRRARLRKQDIA